MHEAAAMDSRGRHSETRRFVLLHVIGIALFATYKIRVQDNSITCRSPAERLSFATTILMGPIALLRTEGARMLGLLGLTFQGLALSLAYHLRRFPLARWTSPILWILWFVLGTRAVSIALG